MNMEKDKEEIEDDGLYCSFCGKTQKEVAKLIAGANVYICNECIDLCNSIIQDETIDNENPEELNGEYVYEILEKHFEPVKLESITSYSYLFHIDAGRKIQGILEKWFKNNKVKFKFIGIGRRYNNPKIEFNFSELWEHQHYPFFVGPTQFEIAELGSNIENRYLKNGLWLCVNNTLPYAIYLDYRTVKNSNVESIYLEVAGIENEDLGFIENLFNSIQSALK